MITISQAVRQVLSSKPELEELLAWDLVNLTALARKIAPEVKEKLHLKEVETSSIAMALRRYEPRTNVQFNQAKEVLKQVKDITLRSNLVKLTFESSPQVLKKEKELVNKLEEQEYPLVSHRGVREFTLTVLSKYEKQVLKIFSETKPASLVRDLSAITLSLPRHNVEVPGVYYLILKSLAFQGINIVDLVSTTNELTLLFENDVVDKAFVAIKKLIAT